MIDSILALIVAVWVVGAVAVHAHSAWYYRRYPWKLSSRSHGLISFDDRGYWWFRTLWPLTSVLLLLCYTFLGWCWISERIKGKTRK